MPATISTSLTAADTRIFVYPQNAAYMMASGSDTIMYSMVLMPKSDKDHK